MQYEALIAAIASVASVGVIVQMVVRQVRSTVNKAKSEREIASYADSQLQTAHIERLIITVTNEETKDSVQLPPQYDRKAVSKFLEMTA